MLDTVGLALEERDFSPGDLIYEQASPSSGVYMILEGRIEISRTDHNKTYSIATLSEGQLLGEVSAIEQVAHSVNARAVTKGRLIHIPSDAFRRSFADPLVRFVVHTLAARLRNTVETGAELQKTQKDLLDLTNKHEQAAREAQVDKSHYGLIESGAPLIKTQIPTPIAINDLPFLIGRLQNEKTVQAHLGSKALLLALPKTSGLADEHFELLRRDGMLYVRDLGAPGGTQVNGQRLSRYRDQSLIRLEAGSTNLVIAGGDDSPVRFYIHTKSKQAS